MGLLHVQDEPTSGLDARAAAIVMRTVRNTVNTGRTVVCTIHQPSIDIFEVGHCTLRVLRLVLSHCLFLAVCILALFPKVVSWTLLCLVFRSNSAVQGMKNFTSTCCMGMQAFDDLLLLKSGGQVIYHGSLGKKSSKLIEYFEVGSFVHLSFAFSCKITASVIDDHVR
jgi:hypothetical protein